MVSASISYVSDIPSNEKPYHMMYGDHTSLARTNIQRKWIATTFEDIRGHEADLSFEESGILIKKLASNMRYEDFDDDAKIRNVYFAELERCLKDVLAASEVKVFRYGIRKRHPTFPISTGTEYEFAQPTSIAHIDATLASTKEEIVRQYGHNADGKINARFQWVNVWRPLRGPINDWPLCFCDASTTATGDLLETDMVYPDYYTENLSLRYSQDQRWYFLSDHQPDEVIIFKQSDSNVHAAAGVGHCSFDNPGIKAGEVPRESIEARALVFY